MNDAESALLQKRIRILEIQVQDLRERMNEIDRRGTGLWHADSVAAMKNAEKEGS